MREAFRQYPPDSGESLWEQVEALDEFGRAGTILIYMALPDEVPTTAFIEKWRGEKRFVIPRVKGEGLELKVYDPEAIQSGYRGIPEPSDKAEDVSPSEIDLALIPGVAFDREGHRMGRGKGFYDRFLPSIHCPSVAICQAWRIVGNVPTDPWDKTVDIVLG